MAFFQSYQNSVSKNLVFNIDIDDSNVIKYFFVGFGLTEQKLKVHLSSYFYTFICQFVTDEESEGIRGSVDKEKGTSE